MIRSAATILALFLLAAPLDAQERRHAPPADWAAAATMCPDPAWRNRTLTVPSNWVSGPR